ncbi:hypothetical protein TNCV_413991 [Trichonephila clavipes]|nr:hypothetical protein TNCV_413991 [Trichonephila clavipes]
MGGGEFLLTPRGPARQGPPQSQQPVVASGEPPALQCRTPSRHHLELQDRRDYAPADRAARACWLGRPGLLYYLAARDAKPNPPRHPPQGRPLQDPTSPVQRSSEVQNPAPSARPPREQSAAPPHQKRKTIRHNPTPPIPGPPQDPVTEKQRQEVEHKKNQQSNTKEATKSKY